MCDPSIVKCHIPYTDVAISLVHMEGDQCSRVVTLLMTGAQGHLLHACPSLLQTAQTNSRDICSHYPPFLCCISANCKLHREKKELSRKSHTNQTQGSVIFWVSLTASLPEFCFNDQRFLCMCCRCRVQ